MSTYFRKCSGSIGGLAGWAFRRWWRTLNTVRPSITSTSGQLGTPAFVPTTRFGNLRKDIWGREHFVWLPEEDAYRCPAGQKLRRSANVRGTRRVQYRAPKGSSCPVRPACNVRPQAEKEPSTALGRKSLSSLLRNG
jgi:uncharacterized protein YraI